MVSFRHYQELNHNHSHYCPSCQVDLVDSGNDFTNTDAERFSCPTKNCPVTHCYCNGTVDSYSITIKELFRCVEDIFSYFDENVTDVISKPNKEYQLGGDIRDYIDTHINELSVKDEISVEQRFEVFARLERTLERRDYSTYLQDSKTKERVIDFHGVYAVASEVLVYTVVTDEFEESKMIRYPKAYAEYIDEENVESFEQNFGEQFSDYFSVEK